MGGGSQWGRSEGAKLEGENKRGGGVGVGWEGWSRVIKLLKHLLLHPPQYGP